MTLGPILAGALTERFGYYWMCWTLSKISMRFSILWLSLTLTGVISVVMAIMARIFLGSKSTEEKDRTEEESTE